MAFLSSYVDSPWTGVISSDMWNEAAWGVSGVLDEDCSSDWSELFQSDVTCESSFTGASDLDAPCKVPWNNSTPLDFGCTSPYLVGDSALDLGCKVPWNANSILDDPCKIPWGIMDQLDSPCKIPWEQMTPLDDTCKIPWEMTTPLDIDCIAPWLTATPLDGFCKIDTTQNQEENDGVKVFNCKIPWRAVRSYIVTTNNITFKRVSDDQEINLLNCTIGTDINSFGWSISGAVATRIDAGYIRPVRGPVETELVLNGYTWRFFVENISDSYEYRAGGGYSFNGISPSVELAKPYDKPVTKVYTGATQAQQIVNGEIASEGWAWDWNIIDWAIPANVFSVNNMSKAEIISTIAKAVGGFVNTKGGFPDGTPYEKRLTFNYRYPTTPFDWSTTAADVTIVDGILSQSVAWEPKPGYNHLYVSGQDSGVIVHVKRDGVAWDNAGPTIVDPLVLIQNVARYRGRNFLDEEGDSRAVYTMSFPLPDSSVGNPPVIHPAYLLEVTDLFDTWKGKVRAVRIEANPFVTMTIEVERIYISRLTVIDPVILPASGAITTADDITMSTLTPGADIYYTIDGSDPDQTDTEYTGAFNLSAGSVTVKAKAYKTDYIESGVTSNSYTVT